VITPFRFIRLFCFCLFLFSSFCAGLATWGFRLIPFFVFFVGEVCYDYGNMVITFKSIILFRATALKYMQMPMMYREVTYTMRAVEYCRLLLPKRLPRYMSAMTLSANQKKEKGIRKREERTSNGHLFYSSPTSHG
jgi:hypothetical protein